MPPERYDIRVEPEGVPEYWADEVAHRIRPVFDSKKPAALFIGTHGRLTMGTRP